MKALIGAVVLMLMGAVFLRLPRNERFMRFASHAAPNRKIAELAIRSGGMVVLMLSLVSLLVFVAWLGGYVE